MPVEESKITEREESSIMNLHKHASEMDMQFLKDVVVLETCPEYTGYNTTLYNTRLYNTRFLRNICYSIKQETAVIYQLFTSYLPAFDRHGTY